MSDRLVAWLRTVVPAAWAALITWLVSLGVPAYVTDALGDVGAVVVLPIVLGAVYALFRWIEPHLPVWLARILLGSAQRPTYPGNRTPLAK